MEPGYHIETVPADGVIRMIFTGFWDDSTATAFAGDMDVAMKQLAGAGIKPGEFLYLADFRAGMIQSSLIVERFQQFAANIGVQARRVAVLCASTLQKMQIQRMAESYDHYAFFLSGEEDAATAWLMKDKSALKSV